MKAHGGELEILTAEQIGIAEKQDEQSKAEEQQKRQCDQIDEQGQQRDLDAFDQTAKHRQRAARRIVRIVLAFDQFGDLIDKETADEGAHRRHQEQRAGDDAQARHDRQDPG